MAEFGLNENFGYILAFNDPCLGKKSKKMKNPKTAFYLIFHRIASMPIFTKNRQFGFDLFSLFCDFFKFSHGNSYESKPRDFGKIHIGIKI